MRPGNGTSYLRALWSVLTRPRGPRSHAWYPQVRKSRRSTSGVALLVVMAAIMIMTVLVTDMNYGARIRLLMATHQRNESQAYWLARSGVNIYKLILMGSQQVKKMGIPGYVQDMLPFNISDGIWQAIPVFSTALMRMLFASGSTTEDLEAQDIQDIASTGHASLEAELASREAGRFSGKSFLDFDGDFVAEIVDEDSKINLNNFKSITGVQIVQENPTAKALYGIMSGQENDQWFYDRNLDRWDLIANLKDWVDADTTKSTAAGGYEDDLYNRLATPYLAKNASFDSKEEIRLVEGWQGEVYERYKEQLTVWGSGKINVNTASHETLFGLLKSYGNPPPTDETVQRVLTDLEEYKLFVAFKKEQDFIDYVKNQGMELSADIKNVVSVSSTVFTITSQGIVGDTVVTITAVLDYSSNPLGTTAFWKVD